MAQIFFTTILLHSFTFLVLTVANDHILFPNRKLAIGHTLISQNQAFEMGFFSPGKSLNRFLGIWYKSTPDVVVWVANRNNPITHSQSQGVVFMISGSGNLVISRGKSIIWSASSPGVASNPVLQLLETGNLVLVDDTKEGYIWQSFLYPTDTLLPGMTIADDVDAGVQRNLTSWRSPDDPSTGDFVHVIENRGLPKVVILRGTIKIYRFGQWNGIYFCDAPRVPTDYYKPDFVFKEERLTYAGELHQGSVLMRTRLDTSGSRGFSPKFQEDWNLQDWSGGCTRTKPLNCKGGDGFLEVRGVKYPAMSSFQLSRSMSLSECRGECLRNCNCAADANPFITNGDNGCLMWHGDLIDTKELSAAHSKQNIYIRVPLFEQDFSTDLEEEKEKKSPVKLILISMASGILVSGFINVAVLLMATRKRQVKRNNEDLELPVIKMATIVRATNNFSRENMLGAGGFGPVYKGIMPLGDEIAVKRLSSSSGQGLEEFKNEVMVIAKLQHRNLVRLLGCCIEEEESILIYEYLQNKSLDYIVFDRNRKKLLTWPKCFDIIMGVARGLLYLHQDSRLKIIHRDLKTSNILLDGNLNPKISDFGLARIFEEHQSLARTKRVVGTYGYMAPEYAIDGKFSEKSDIFSFGVVLLEIISGQKNRGFEHCDHSLNLLGHAWLLWKEDNTLELMDKCFNDTFVESEVKRCVQVGLLCVQKFAEDRPTMSSLISMLGTDGAVLPEPKEPGFFIERSSSPTTVKGGTSPTKSENGTVTITDLVAR